MSKLRIEKGTAKSGAALRVTIDGNVVARSKLMCECTRNESSTPVYPLLPFAIKQSEDFQKFWAHYGVTALPCKVRDPDREGKCPG
jgi:hypothetical protein